MSEHKVAKVFTPSGEVREGVVVKETTSGTGMGGVIGAIADVALGGMGLAGGAIGAAIGSEKKSSATIRTADGREVTGEVVKDSRRSIHTES